MMIECTELTFEIPPGGIKQVAVQHREVESEHAEFRVGEADMYVAGNIVYAGPDKIERRTGFCRKWSSAGDGSWRPVRDAAYEYSY